LKIFLSSRGTACRVGRGEEAIGRSEKRADFKSSNLDRCNMHISLTIFFCNFKVNYSSDFGWLAAGIRLAVDEVNLRC
jgi:hypothetical protein